MDSFKGSLSSLEACQAVGEGISASCPRPCLLPVSDGGEGFIDSYIHNLGGERFSLEVSGPYYDAVDAEYGIIAGGSTAVIEMASASGLCLSDRKDPLHATTYGTGEIIKHVLDKGIRNILLGLGGSATNDGGLGVLCALGAELRDEADLPVKPDASGLASIRSVDTSGIHPELSNCSFTVCCDVKNKLLGPQGASAVYGPQKGASPQDVKFLDDALGNFRDVLLEATGKDISGFEGSGAAGGLAAGLSAFADVRIRSGIELLLEKLDFASILEGAILVITGEGRIDSQTAEGKVPVGIAAAVRRNCGDKVPVIALVGEMREGYQAVYDMGITAVFSLLHRAASFEEIRDNAYNDLKDTAANVARLFFEGDMSRSGQE